MSSTTRCRADRLMGVVLSIASTTPIIATSCQTTNPTYEPKIVCGTEVAESQYPAVFPYTTQTEPTSDEIAICTATWISPHIALSAAHCFPPTETLDTPIDGSAYLAYDRDDAPFARVYAHPDFWTVSESSGNQLAEIPYDVAVMISTTAFAGPPAPIYFGQLRGGLAVDLVGYGDVTKDVNPEAPFPPPKSAGSNRLEYAGPVLTLTSPGFEDCRQKRASIYYGDSGGPLLVKDAIVGIAHGGTPDAKVSYFANLQANPAQELLRAVAAKEPELAPLLQ